MLHISSLHGMLASPTFLLRICIALGCVAIAINVARLLMHGNILSRLKRMRPAGQGDIGKHGFVESSNASGGRFGLGKYFFISCVAGAVFGVLNLNWQYLKGLIGPAEPVQLAERLRTEFTMNTNPAYDHIYQELSSSSQDSRAVLASFSQLAQKNRGANFGDPSKSIAPTPPVARTVDDRTKLQISVVSGLPFAVKDAQVQFFDNGHPQVLLGQTPPFSIQRGQDFRTLLVISGRLPEQGRLCLTLPQGSDPAYLTIVENLTEPSILDKELNTASYKVASYHAYYSDQYADCQKRGITKEVDVNWLSNLFSVGSTAN